MNRYKFSFIAYIITGSYRITIKKPPLLKLVLLLLINSLTIIFILPLPSIWASPPQEALAIRQSAELLAQQGDLQKAVEAYEQALKIYPHYAEVYYALGLIYDLERGETKKAIECYQKFLALTLQDTEDAQTIRLMLESAQQALQKSLSPSGESHPFIPADEASIQEEKKAARLKEKEINTENKMKIPDTEKNTRTEEEKGVMAEENKINTEDETKINLPEEGASQEITYKKSPDGRYLTYLIEDKILKYNLKLRVWQREGYIQKFNELALARGSSLTNNIAQSRDLLRQNRQKVTEFINYQKEAEQFLLHQGLHDILKKEWQIDLSNPPQGIKIEEVVSYCRILDSREDKKNIWLSLETQIDLKNLENQLASLGYQFNPLKVQLYCSNLYGEFNERFLEAICRKSAYIKNRSEGLYEIYTSLENLAKELSKMMIGSYIINIKEIDRNKIVFNAEVNDK